MPVKKKGSYEFNPGELYQRIQVTLTDFKDGEEPLEKRKEHPFVLFCRKIYKKFPSLGKGEKFQKEYKDAVKFLGWDLEAEEFNAAVKLILFGSIILSAVLGLIVYVSPIGALISSGLTGGDFLFTLIYSFAPFIVISLVATNYIQSFPIAEAKAEQVRALTYVPEIVGYLTMSMKLVPNLEKSIEFAAEHGKGKVAEEFKRIIWDVQVGVYNTLSEALDELAYNWGNFSSEFKEALMMIRASVLENEEGKRYALLDKTMEGVLTSVREKMEQYARNLSQPSIILFYLGVLLPLILIIVLPVGSAFTGQPIARPEILILLYNIILPGIAFAFAINLIKQRPPTYTPPIIPDSHPKLFGKLKMKIGTAIVDLRAVVVGVLILGIIFSLFLSTQGIPPKFLLPENSSQIVPADKDLATVLEEDNKPADYFELTGPYATQLRNSGKFSDEEGLGRKLALDKAKFLLDPENDVSPYNLTFGLVLTFSICAYVFLHYSSIYKRKIQLEIMQMETEFKDALYVLASRLGENKPVEEALKHTRDFLPNYLISTEIFGRAVDNISLLGLTLEQSFFDPVYGVLKDIPSTMIKGSMKLLVDSVTLGVNVAARTLISLSLQLNNSEKVTKMLSSLVTEITSMMETMAVFIAPVVLGITTSLQKVVMLTLSQISTSSTATAMTSIPTGGAALGFGVEGLAGAAEVFIIKPEVLLSLANPTQFLLIVAIYVIELVIIMIYYTTKIEEDNDLKMRLNIGRSLPIAVTVFLVSAYVGNIVIGGFF